MLQTCIIFVMVIAMMMVDMTTATRESLQVNGSPQLGYYLQLGLGTPPEAYRFLVDTGSSNLVIAGVKQTDISYTFNPARSSTFIDNNTVVDIQYLQGRISGYLGLDRLHFISFYISDVPVVVFEESWNLFGNYSEWQGILGLAFDSLTKPSPEETQSVLTLLQQQHNDIADVFSLRLCPPLDIYGEINLPRKSNMVLGGVDRNDYHGDIYYTPIVKQQYYNVLFSNISVDGVMIPLQCSELNDDVTIVDSGTSEVFLNEAVFGAVVKLLQEYFMRRGNYSPPEEFWTANEQLSWPAKHDDIYNVFPTITFHFPLHDNASMQFGVTMPPQLYLRKVERVTTSNISCDDKCDLYVFSIRSKPSGSLLGSNLMNGYNVVFDRHNMRLGFAVTSCDLRDNTYDQPKITDPQPRDFTIDCSYHNDDKAVDTSTTTTTRESLQVNGSPQLGYYLQLGLGTPSEGYNFLVDTGSSNLVIAGVKQTNVSYNYNHKKSSTFIDYHKTVEIEYSQGGFSGYLGSDQLQFISFYISDVTIAVIEESWNFFGTDPQWQGILGLAFDSLMKPSPEDSHSVLTLLQQQHNDIADVFSLRLCPPLDLYGITNLPQKSNMVLGGVDRNDYHGDIYYTPIVKQQYYNVLFSNISVDGVMIPLQCSKLNDDVTIVDSGTSEVFLNEAVFGAVVKLLKEYFMRRDDYSPPEEFWTANEQLSWPAKHNDIYNVFPTITFYFPLHDNPSMQFGVTMPPQLYLRKVERVTTSNVSCDDKCDLFVFSIRSKPSGSLLGNNLMNGYNVVFDRHNMRLGFAVTSCDLRDNTYDQPKITDPQPRDDSVECGYHDDEASQSVLGVIFVIAALVVAALTVMTSFTIYYFCNRRKQPRGLVRLQEECDEDDHHDNTINDQPTVQAAQEAGGRSAEMQVGLTANSEAEQTQYSKETMKELIYNKLFDKYHPTPASSLVARQSYPSNLCNTVT